jgi:hypothetical protein
MLPGRGTRIILGMMEIWKICHLSRCRGEIVVLSAKKLTERVNTEDLERYN